MSDGASARCQKYMVRLEGRNFRMEEDEEILPMGFLATRFVEAASPDSAAQMCAGFVQDEYVGLARNADGDPPTISVTEVVEIESFGEYDVPGRGATWFEEEDGRDT